LQAATLRTEILLEPHGCSIPAQSATTDRNISDREGTCFSENEPHLCRQIKGWNHAKRSF
jgi:hypothetical protein